MLIATDGSIGVELGWAGGVAGLREINDSQQWANSCHMSPVILGNELVLRFGTLLWRLNSQANESLYSLPPAPSPYFFPERINCCTELGSRERWLWLECQSVRDTGALQKLNSVLHVNCPLHTLAGVVRLFPTQISHLSIVLLLSWTP